MHRRVPEALWHRAGARAKHRKNDAALKAGWGRGHARGAPSWGRKAALPTAPSGAAAVPPAAPAPPAGGAFPPPEESRPPHPSEQRRAKPQPTESRNVPGNGKALLTLTAASGL